MTTSRCEVMHYALLHVSHTQTQARVVQQLKAFALWPETLEALCIRVRVKGAKQQQ